MVEKCFIFLIVLLKGVLFEILIFRRAVKYLFGSHDLMLVQNVGPLYPPKIIDEEMFSCEVAASKAYDVSQLGK